jgi:hypothetical protein
MGSFGMPGAISKTSGLVLRRLRCALFRVLLLRALLFRALLLPRRRPDPCR